MEKKVFTKLFAFLGILAGLALVVGACAPALVPGAAPREIPGPATQEEAAPVAQPQETVLPDAATALASLPEDQRAVVEAATLEDVLGRQIESIQVPSEDNSVIDTSGAPVSGQFEEHMVTEFTTATVSPDDEFLSAFAPAPVVGPDYEVHMTTEFPTGTISLDDEMTAAMQYLIDAGQVSAPSVDQSAVAPEDLTPSVDQGAIAPEDLAPTPQDVTGLQFENIQAPSEDNSVIDTSGAPVSGQFEEHMVTQFTTATVSLDDEILSAYAPAPVVDPGYEVHMVTEFPTGTASLDDEMTAGMQYLIDMGQGVAPSVDQGAVSSGDQMPSNDQVVPENPAPAPDGGGGDVMGGYSY